MSSFCQAMSPSDLGTSNWFPASTNQMVGGWEQLKAGEQLKEKWVSLSNTAASFAARLKAPVWAEGLLKTKFKIDCTEHRDLLAQM